MKCVCGYERLGNSVLSRMIAGPDNSFRVELYGSDNRLLAASQPGLEMTEALAFVEQTVGTKATVHYHWETRHSSRARLTAATANPETPAALPALTDAPQPYVA